jgi:DNA-binding NarL/FixJ family response regulator
MCTAAGRVEFASERARGWLSRARFSAIESHVRRADKLPSECSYAVLDNVQLRIVRTLGDGATRYLVLLSDTRAFERSPLSDLSARQVQIGEFAAAGATATEIAAELSLSPHTVRQHLKVVYRELGVRNRVELASVFDR